MGGDRRFDLAVAARYARHLAEYLEPGCERIAIAGSIRRRKPAVGDVEVVLVPRLVVEEPQQAALFATSAPGPTKSQAWSLVDDLVAQGRLQDAGARGDRYRRLKHPTSGLQVDLFAVLAPASWGAVFAIRTGSAAFSQSLMRGLIRQGRRCVKGAVYVEDTCQRCGGEELPRSSQGAGVCDCGGKGWLPGDLVWTPEESDFFAAAGVELRPPEERT